MSKHRSAGGNADPSSSLGAGPGRSAPAPVAVHTGTVAALSLEVGLLISHWSTVPKIHGPTHTPTAGGAGGKPDGGPMGRT